jgi:hypothetical protein
MAKGAKRENWNTTLGSQGTLPKTDTVAARQTGKNVWGGWGRKGQSI